MVWRLNWLTYSQHKTKIRVFLFFVTFVVCSVASFFLVEPLIQDDKISVDDQPKPLKSLVGIGSTEFLSLMNDINQHYDEYDVQYSNQDNQEIPLIDLVENKVHFVVTNSPPPDLTSVGISVIPFSLSSIAVVYNLEVNDTVNLTGNDLLYIYKGNITLWNDSSIEIVNLQNLPGNPIVPLHRTDPEGSAMVLEALCIFETMNAKTCENATKSVNWVVPNPSGWNVLKSDTAVIDAVLLTENSLSYTSFPSTIVSPIKIASVGSMNSSFLMPSVPSVQEVSNRVHFDPDHPIQNAFQVTCESCYPLVYPVYLLYNSNEFSSNCSYALAIRDYVTWLYSSQAEIVLNSLNYVSINENSQGLFKASLQQSTSQCEDGGITPIHRVLSFVIAGVFGMMFAMIITIIVYALHACWKKRRLEKQHYSFLLDTDS